MLENIWCHWCLKAALTLWSCLHSNSLSQFRIHRYLLPNTLCTCLKCKMVYPRLALLSWAEHQGQKKGCRLGWVKLKFSSTLNLYVDSQFLAIQKPIVIISNNWIFLLVALILNFWGLLLKFKIYFLQYGDIDIKRGILVNIS